MPWQAVRWLIAFKTGWPLEYIDTLDIGDVSDMFAVIRGQNEAQG